MGKACVLFHHCISTVCIRIRLCNTYFKKGGFKNLVNVVRATIEVMVSQERETSQLSRTWVHHTFEKYIAHCIIPFFS